MAAALPLAKLGGLLIKTLSKPLSKRVKLQFTQYEIGQNILVRMGQTTHYITSRMTILAAGYQVRTIKPLDHEKALTRGADFVGESFVLLVSGGVVLWEYDRGRTKDGKKREKLLAEQHLLESKLMSLDARLKALENVVKKNSQSILTFGPRYEEPTNVVPIDRKEAPETENSKKTEPGERFSRWWSR